MPKVLTFSTTYPAHHKRAGGPTYFHFKYLSSLKGCYDKDDIELLVNNLEDFYYKEKVLVSHITNMYNGVIGENRIFTGVKDIVDNIESKNHTIRSLSKNGESRWKAGDFFSPRIWIGKPYHSEQFTIAPYKKIEKVYDIEINGKYVAIEGFLLKDKDLDILASNEGLSLGDLKEWLKMPCQFKGQIIVWNKEIEY